METRHRPHLTLTVNRLSWPHLFMFSSGVFLKYLPRPNNGAKKKIRKKEKEKENPTTHTHTYTGNTLLQLQKVAGFGVSIDIISATSHTQGVGQALEHKF